MRQPITVFLHHTRFDGDQSRMVWNSVHTLWGGQVTLGGMTMDDMIPHHSSPALLPMQKKSSRPKGRWAIALALLFLIMVARHRGGWLANIARHDMRSWLTTSTKIPALGIASRVAASGPQKATVAPHRVASSPFLSPVANARLIQGFGWVSTHGTATFHSTILVAGASGAPVICGFSGTVESRGAHEVSFMTANHSVVTYLDLASVSVRSGQPVRAESVVGRLGPSGHLGIAVTDQGLPINPLVASYFGPRAFS